MVARNVSLGHQCKHKYLINVDKILYSFYCKPRLVVIFVISFNLQSRAPYIFYFFFLVKRNK